VSATFQVAQPSKGQLRRNMIANVAFLALSVTLGLWYTPFVIDRLGVATYSLVPLAGSLTNYMSIVGVAVSGVVARNITSALARGDAEGANREFNLSFRLALYMGGALLVLAVLFALAMPRLLNVPAGQEMAARILMVSVAAAFLATIIGSPFDCYTWAANRFDVRNALDAVGLVIRTGVVVLLFSWTTPALSAVSLGVALSAAFLLLSTTVACRRLVPVLRLNEDAISWREVKSLWLSSRWVVLNQTGMILMANLDLVLINVLLGPEIGGRYSPLLQWVVYLRSAVNSVTLALGPSILLLYAQGDSGRLNQLCRQSVKLAGLMACIPVTLLCGFSRPLLDTWLGPSFAEFAPLAWLLLVPLCAEAAQSHLGVVALAADNIRGWALANIGAGLIMVVLSLVLVKGFELGLYGVAVASAIVSLGRNGVFSTRYTARILRQNWWPCYGQTILLILVYCLAGGLLVNWVASRSELHSLLKIALTAAPCGLVLAAGAFFFLLDAGERSLVRVLLLRRSV